MARWFQMRISIPGRFCYVHPRQRPSETQTWQWTIGDLRWFFGICNGYAMSLVLASFGNPDPPRKDVLVCREVDAGKRLRLFEAFWWLDCSNGFPSCGHYLTDFLSIFIEYHIWLLLIKILASRNGHLRQKRFYFRHLSPSQLLWRA